MFTLSFYLLNPAVLSPRVAAHKQTVYSQLFHTMDKKMNLTIGSLCRIRFFYTHVTCNSVCLSFISFMARILMHILIIFSHTTPHFPVTPVFSYCSYFKPRFPCLFLHCPLDRENIELHPVFQCLSKYLAKRC